MPFRENRALAFAEYTLTAMIAELPGKILTISRQDLARVLDVEKLWDKHIEVIREAAAKEDVGVANLGNKIAFVSFDKNVELMDAKEAKEITDKFDRMYGSAAADDMWESGSYRGDSKKQKSTKR